MYCRGGVLQAFRYGYFSINLPMTKQQLGVTLEAPFGLHFP